MKIREIMNTQVQRTHPGAPISEVAEQMKIIDVGMIPVYDGDQLVGTVTDRDLAVRAVAEKRDPIQARISEVMSRGVIYCFDDQEVEEAAKLMAEKKIRRLLVCNRADRPVGIISLGDLATASKQAAAEVLENISKSTACNQVEVSLRKRDESVHKRSA